MVGSIPKLRSQNLDKKMTVMIKFNDKIIPGEAMKSFKQIFWPKLSDSFEFKLDLMI